MVCGDGKDFYALQWLCMNCYVGIVRVWVVKTGLNFKIEASAERRMKVLNKQGGLDFSLADTGSHLSRSSLSFEVSSAVLIPANFKLTVQRRSPRHRRACMEPSSQPARE